MMAAKLKLFVAAVVLSGLIVAPVGNGAAAAVPVDPLGLTAAETQQFKDLIDPATFDGTAVTALVAWLERLREDHPDPGVIGEISVDLALLVEDDHPNKDTILALIQDMLSTAAGNPVYVGPDTLNLSENPSQDASSPVQAASSPVGPANILNLFENLNQNASSPVLR